MVGSNRAGKNYSSVAPLLIGAAIVVGLLAFTFWFLGNSLKPQQAAVKGGQPGTKQALPEVTLTTAGVIAYTNKARQENGGLALLTESQLLHAVARERMNDMIQKHYFAHVSPSGESATDAAQKVGYPYSRIGENIAEGFFANDEKLVLGWMQSPGHRQNILSDEFSEIGVAIGKGMVKGEPVSIAVQIFGRQSPPVSQPTNVAGVSSEKPSDSCARPDESLLKTINSMGAEMTELRNSLEEMRGQIDLIKSKVDRGEGEPTASASDYNARVQRFNQLLLEAKTKEAQAREMTSLYNGQVDKYNACIRQQ